MPTKGANTHERPSAEQDAIRRAKKLKNRAVRMTGPKDMKPGTDIFSLRQQDFAEQEKINRLDRLNNHAAAARSIVDQKLTAGSHAHDYAYQILDAFVSVTPEAGMKRTTAAIKQVEAAMTESERSLRHGAFIKATSIVRGAVNATYKQLSAHT